MVDGSLGVGVIGSGGMGGRHAHNLAHRVAAARVVAIMDTDGARADAVASACGAASVFTDPDALIGDAAVEAVVIGAPDSTHADLTIACIEAGKPVLCEKPLGVDLADAERVVEAEMSAGRRLVQVGLMRMYDPQHAALKRAIDEGAIGRPLLFRGLHRNLGRPRVVTAAQVIVEGSVHDIQSARWLMDDEVSTAYASQVSDARVQPEGARLVLLQLTFRGGGLATIENNLDSNYGYEITVEVCGERGTLATPSLSAPILRQEGVASRAVEVDWLERFETAYVLEAEAWVDAARKGTATGPSAWDGHADMRVADAAARSLVSGRAEPLPDEPRPALYERR